MTFRQMLSGWLASSRAREKVLLDLANAEADYQKTIQRELDGSLTEGYMRRLQVAAKRTAASEGNRRRIVMMSGKAFNRYADGVEVEA